ncbi:MAG: Asp-tRNA(Asn)/Glu-tRNA(Gln) amidotransferase subunit GatC [Candidatus Omnitrophota bacterium]|nr:Asp-tRNA(Asn)/Glu-tRNA(Gln) amidotransferase subunit GatC [Candidatus Omnitrophota bacterium]
MITKDDLKYVAHLARLSLSEKEIEHFTVQLEGILKYINKLKQVDVSNVEPTSHVFPQKNIYRQDELKPSLSIKEALKNAPSKEGDFFKVPKIIE